MKSSFFTSSPIPRAMAAGAGGGLLSFFVGEQAHLFFEGGDGIFAAVLGSGVWAGAIGVTIGAAILVFDNLSGLRGQWHRDLARAVPLFFVLGLSGGVAGQLAFSVVQNSLTRGIGWALMGAGIGMGIGKLRRDPVQAARGALGGVIGGFLGGFAFDALAQISSAGEGAFSRFVGQITLGALVALLMRAVQEALKDAYLLGVSTGPYEGKEYPLNTARVTVGRADSNDISLFREETAPLQLGALVFQGGNWAWQGNAVPINGAAQASAVLTPGDTLQLGATNFRFYSRAGRSPVTVAAPVAVATTIAPTFNAAPVTAPVVTASVAPKPRGALWSRPGAAKTPVSTMMTAIYVMETTDGQSLTIAPGEAQSVGRAVQNNLILSDAGVSSNHATLQIEGGQLMVCDLNSTNGTFVNEARIAPQTPHPLQVGDRVRFGKSEATVRAG